MLAHAGSFSAPVHQGALQSDFLPEVLAWLQARGSYTPTKSMLDVAQVALSMLARKESDCHAQRLRSFRSWLNEPQYLESSFVLIRPNWASSSLSAIRL